MRWAIFSDIHDNGTSFHRLLAAVEQQQVDRLVCLGDVGHSPALLDELRRQEIPCTFGNWEVSGLARMDDRLADWIGGWPATIRADRAIFCHATPDMPAQARTTLEARRYMAERRVGWLTLFPRLHRNEDALWTALARMEQDDVQVAFHGHTHVQLAWAWQPDQAGRRQLRTVSRTELRLEPGRDGPPARYVVGVGSVGAPADGSALRYVLYDDTAGTVQLCALQ